MKDAIADSIRKINQQDFDDGKECREAPSTNFRSVSVRSVHSSQQKINTVDICTRILA